MKYLVQVQLKPGSKRQMMDAFETKGPNRTPGVSYRAGWIAAQEDAAFILLESQNEAALARAQEAWPDIGEVKVTRVIDIEQF